ncbi:hypothetical protein TNCV_4623961 [Trichonephila clavipes]|nr:hypothetical protein TNCV_4623961 [Trichonephila clavipes]
MYSIETFSLLLTFDESEIELVKIISDSIASLAWLFFRSIANQKRVVHDCTTTGPGYAIRCYTRTILAIRGGRMVFCTPRIHPKPCDESIHSPSANSLGKSLGYHSRLFTTNPSEEETVIYSN